METLALSDVPAEYKRAKPVRDVYEMSAASLDDNCIKGSASVMGNMDRDGRVVFPGFFAGVLKRFTTDGFVAVGHDWDDLPVAMPMVAKEDGNQLYTEALFHTTARAQDARTVCSERLANKKSVGLSTGWLPDYSIDADGEYKGIRYFENGKALLAYAEETGCDMSLFDKPAIRAWTGYCRGMIPDGCRDLFEYSIVTIPSNRKAMATQVASVNDRFEGFDPAQCDTERAFEDFLRDAGWSRKQATAIALHGYKASLQRDAEVDEADGKTETPAETPAVATETVIQVAAASALHSLRLREMRLREWSLSLFAPA